MTDSSEKYDSDLVLDLSRVVPVLVRRRWWLIGCIAFFSVAATAFAFTVDPVYRATVLLAPAGVGRSESGAEALLGQLGGIAALAGVSVPDQDREIEEALAVLRSREFTERFFAEVKALPHFYPESSDAKDPPPSPARAYRQFDREVRRANQSKKTGLVTLEVDWTDRVLAAEWANQLVRQLNAEMRSRALAEADRSLEFLNRELASTQVVEVRDALNRLIESQVKQRMLASVRDAFRVVDRAVPADVDNPLSPNKPAYFVGGFVIGAAVGLMLAFMLEYRRGRRPVSYKE